MDSEKKQAAEERRLKRIAQLKATLAQNKALLQKEEALFNQEKRKERNGQLITAGVMVELLYKTATPEKQESLKKKATELLSDERSRSRMSKMFARLDADLTDGQPVETDGRADEQSETE